MVVIGARAIVMRIAILAAVCAVAACCDTARVADPQTVGPKPTIPAANPPLIPTLHIATPDPWPAGKIPTTASSLSVRRLASGLKHPRSLLVLPNGDILVAESDTPSEYACGFGLKGVITRWVMRSAGASQGSADRITLLRPDKDGSIRAYEYITGLKSPFGMALVGSDLYVANTDALLKFPYVAGDTRMASTGVVLRELPAGCDNYHWTKNLVASADARKLYVSVGSNSDHGQLGPKLEEGRAAIYELDLASGHWERFASGLRNPTGLAWEPRANALWTAVNERDELGSDLVPDYMTSVSRGADFGWPCAYYGDRPDTRVPAEWACPATPAFAKPEYALGNHTASLGLAFASNAAWPAELREGAFVAQHGSWNRRPWSGYKVIFVPFANGKPSGPPIDVLWGFREGDVAYGRPVAVAIDRDGALLVTDDVGNSVWRVAPR